MRKLFSVFLLSIIGIYLCATISFGETVDLTKAATYTSWTLFDKATALVKQYPDILEMEILGYSTDNRPIYVIRMGQRTLRDGTPSTDILVEAGMHSREVINPAIVLKIVEDYAGDFYTDSVLPDVNVADVLKGSCIHFIPLSNPDGFDLAKIGKAGIQQEPVRTYLEKNVRGSKYNLFKANLRGVDINRNFEDIYYSKQRQGWVDQWGIVESPLVAYAPSDAYYSGPSAASEVETRVLQSYLLRYDFRAYLSYHSMGRTVYWDKPYLPSAYNDVALGYGKIASSTTGYSLAQTREPEKVAGGFSSHYAINSNLKPYITVETLASRTWPTPAKLYKTEYTSRKLYQLPAAFVNKAKSDGYSTFKIYKDGLYVRDIIDKEYAQAVAVKLGGTSVEYPGPPVHNLIEQAAVAGNHLQDSK